ncbi:50S ribosomal protein L21 [Brevundimonas sp.]|uniref:50S ribosomal protein L21 n=1 Tax=Brevundimonas sp. TaxID=1871086 RepID=UPI00356627F9
MYAVIKTGGKQYRVQPGDVIVVEKLDGDVGSNISFGDVLMLGGDKGVTLGAPLIAGAAVAATLVETRKGEKIKIFKKTRRQGYRRTNGHRQMESVLRITGIDGAGEKAKWDGETSLMTKAEMNLRARGLAPRAAEVEAKPAKAPKAAAPKAEAKPAKAPKAAAPKAEAKPAKAPKAAAPKAEASTDKPAAAKKAPAKKTAPKTKTAPSSDEA